MKGHKINTQFFPKYPWLESSPTTFPQVPVVGVRTDRFYCIFH